MFRSDPIQEASIRPNRPIILALICLAVFEVLSAPVYMRGSRGASASLTANSPPIAADDSYIRHGSGNVGPVLANDYDADGNPMNAQIVSLPTHGELSSVDGNSFYYQLSVPSFTGDDTFTYKACDYPGSCSSPATVTIHVSNSPPTPGPDSYTVRGTTIIGPMFVNDSDPDDASFNGPTIVVGAAHGTVYGLSNPPYANDFKEYVPDTGFAGTDTFQYRITDPLGASGTTTVTLFVLADGENSGVCPTCLLGGPRAVGEPVNVTNGNMYLQQADYSLPNVGPSISITRTYNSNSQRLGLFGKGWSTEYDESIVTYDNNLIRFNQPDGRAIYLGRPSGSSGAYAPLEGDFHGSLIQNGGAGFTLTMLDGSVHQFNSAGKLISLADRLGNQTTLAYDTGGKLTSVTDPFGRVLSFTTNTNGQVLTIADTLGTVATYAYGGSNQLLSVTYADNSAFQFSYDGNYRLTIVTDALGNVVESHTYDGQGRAITSERQGGVEHYSLSYASSTRTDVTDALGHVTKYTFDKSKGRNVVTRVEGVCSCGGSGNQVQTWTYDNQLNVTGKTDALNHTSTFTYDGNGNRLTETDATGTVTYTYNQFGQVLTRADQMSGVTTNTYDAQGNLLTTKDALNNTTTFTYDSHGQLLTATDARGKVTTLTWDSSGRLTQAKDALNQTTDFAYDVRARLTAVTNALSQTTSYEYDAAGRSKKTTFPDNNFITNTYDVAGRRTKFTDARGNDTTLAYDSAYRLTSVSDALNHTTGFGYDAMSNQTSATDALGHVTNYEYDDFNRVKKVIYPPAATGATRLQETLEYDAAGNIAKKTDTAGRDTTYLYDAVNRLTKITDPALQATRFEYNARSQMTGVLDALSQHYTFAYDALGRTTGLTRASVSMSYSYDEVGNRTQRTDYNGVTTNYSYDDVNRSTTISYPDSSGASFGYDALSRVTSATNENGTVSLSYDNRGRVSSTTDVFGKTVGYAYDQNGNRTSMTVGGSTYTEYAYDAVNRPTTLGDSSQTVASYGYDAANKLTSRNLLNGVTSTYEYDGLDQLTHLADAKATTSILDNQYSYNTASQIAQKVDLTGTHGYSYDVVDRLTEATHPSATTETFTYDVVGNRTAATGIANTSYTLGTFNRLASTNIASFGYDNNGNLTSKTVSSATTQYAWDFENRLTQVTMPSGPTVSYKYDALGRRIERSTSNGEVQKFVYDGQDVIQDLNDNDQVVTNYLNGLGIDNKIRQTDANENLYFTADHLSSSIALTNDSGAEVEGIGYDSFGNSTGSSLTRYTYTGREFDVDAGLYYYRARWYDPQMGRFISEDPVGFGGDTNWYSYVGNSPLGTLDPFGLAACKDPEYCRKLLAQILAKTNGFFNAFRPYKDSGFVDKGGKSWSHAGKSGVTGPGQHYNNLIGRQNGIQKDILDYIENCTKSGGSPPPGLERAFEAAKIKVPWPVNLPTRDELRMQEESNRQMERFWHKVLVGDLIVGAVVLRPPLPVLPRVLQWLRPVLAP